MWVRAAVNFEAASLVKKGANRPRGRPSAADVGCSARTRVDGEPCSQGTARKARSAMEGRSASRRWPEWHSAGRIAANLCITAAMRV